MAMPQTGIICLQGEFVSRSRENIIGSSPVIGNVAEEDLVNGLAVAVGLHINLVQLWDLPGFSECHCGVLSMSYT